MKLFGKPLELLILDVDGVILELPGHLDQNLISTAEAFSLPIEPITTYFCQMRRGDIRGVASLSEAVRAFWPDLSEERQREFTTGFHQYERERLYPAEDGSIETIQWFRRHNIPIALCTNNEWGALINRFENVGIHQDWFVVIATADNQFIKPDPRALNPIFELTRVPREHAVFVGDWYPDFETARGADVRFIAALSGGVPRSMFLKEGVPEDHIMSKLSDLERLVEV